ncbi:DUF3889 domain-containing protein [Sporosarcina obsidiansis]|uniref:DUF3889 domain-containing protein n=1 Tax=Sporosarcina obsidiansis TaxID=2660748 RepID=UPI001E48A600|nr:DUF3889 domain-containing protein [Sporosarcina obsidiansis]
MTHPTLKEVCAIIQKLCMALGIALASASTWTYVPIEATAQSEIPSYAKWSRLAIKETQVKYPHANIVDYLHIGSESKKGSTVEKFRLWLKDGNREFGVLVNVTYAAETDKLINIEFQELHFW